MYDLEKIIIRFVGQNTTKGEESDVKLEELEEFHKVSYPELNKVLRKLIKCGLIVESKATLRKFRYLTLTDKGIEACRQDLLGEITCVERKPSITKKTSTKKITGFFK